MITFKWEQILIGIYARRLNRSWMKKNKIWLKVLELLKPNFNFQISIDVRQIIRLPKTYKISRANKKENFDKNSQTKLHLNESNTIIVAR